LGRGPHADGRGVGDALAVLLAAPAAAVGGRDPVPPPPGWRRPLGVGGLPRLPAPAAVPRVSGCRPRPGGNGELAAVPAAGAGRGRRSAPGAGSPPAGRAGPCRRPHPPLESLPPR